MIFDMDDTDSESGFGGGIGDGSGRTCFVRASRTVLADVVSRPDDLRVLCEAGLPQGPFQMAPPIAADDCFVQPSRMVDLDDEVVTVEEEFGVLLLFGAVQGWYLFIHLGDGTVYALPDEPALFAGDIRPMHTDLSSLRRMLVLLHRKERQVEREWTGHDQPLSYSGVRRFADAVEEEFGRVDPVAFSEGSPWNHFFSDLRDGLYSPYYYRPRDAKPSYLPPGQGAPPY
ncbi:SUKH-4 family immunity protein [Streptomyces brevispora]|uniref:SUKH-4 family immunity protein n=1 Tax=Streptomyces brevispora TaxID=887462 RepID=UPI002E311C2F|nr:SUKH-4 family immunity protein [Streptomyces brevispora]